MKKNDKIIPLPSRPQAPQPALERLGEPLQSMRDLTLRRISELLGGLFDKVDDALFDRAESAQNTTMQSESFEGMRELRRKRQRVERLSLDRISQVFIDFAIGKLHAPRIEPAPNASASLSLVEDNELEEALAISSMVAKAETRLARSLYAVNRRLSALRGGTPVENATDPVGPAQLCHAFRIGMSEVDIELAIRLVIYKLFDRHVVANLEPLYDEINTQLIQAGVLPELRHHQVQHSGSGASAARAAATAAAAAAGNAAPINDGADSSDSADGVGPSAIESETTRPCAP